MTSAAASHLSLPAALQHPYGLPQSYGDPAREQAAMREGAIVVARSARGRMTFEGAKAAEVLQRSEATPALVVTSSNRPAPAFR